MTIDPFTQAERLIWFIVESHPGFAERVLPGNRIRLADGTAEAQLSKSSLLPADYPEVVLIPSGGDGESKRNSSGEGFVQRWEFRILTNHLQTDGAMNTTLRTGINAIKWEIVKAFGHWADEFPGLPRIYSMKVVPYEDQAFDFDARAKGWMGMVGVEVSYMWPNSEIERWP